MESSAVTLMTCVEANPVSEGWSAIYSPSPASSPVESVLITLCPRENRDTSALSMVCSTCMIFARRIYTVLFGEKKRTP